MYNVWFGQICVYWQSHCTHITYFPLCQGLTYMERIKPPTHGGMAGFELLIPPLELALFSLRPHSLSFPPVTHPGSFTHLLQKGLKKIAGKGTFFISESTLGNLTELLFAQGGTLLPGHTSPKLPTLGRGAVPKYWKQLRLPCLDQHAFFSWAG